MKFGGLVVLAFALGLLFAGLLDLPTRSLAQQSQEASPAITHVQAPDIPAARPLVELSDAFAAVAERVRPSVVYVSSERTETRSQVPPGFEQFFGRQRPQIQKGTGSGFIVSADGYILTNNHVVEGASTVMVRLLDRREFTAKVIGSDANTDIAVIKIDARNLTPIALGNSDAARIGEWVLAIGNPLGDALAFTVTSGIVSAKGRVLGAGDRSIQDFIQTDAAINPGNSGGPLVNVRGEVIGINSAIASETGFYSGYGFAIPINLAQVVMNQLISGGRVHRAALGISVSTATKEDAEYAGLPEIAGVRIENFQANSPAERAGLEVGDIIVKVDGKPLQYTAQLQQAVGFRKPGETVEVEVARKGGVHKTFSVRLVPMDETVARTADGDQQPESGQDDKPEGSELGMLGATVAPISQDVRQSYELPASVTGLVVTSVDPTGPAAESLIGADERGGPDIIVSVEGKPVRTESDLQAALRQVGPGKIATLRIFNTGANAFGIKRLRLANK
jgi:serine protease Do